MGCHPASSGRSVRSGRRRNPPNIARGEGGGGALTRHGVLTGTYASRRTSMFVSLAGSELSLGTGTTPAPPTHSDDLREPAFVQTLAAEMEVDTLFEPILRGAAAPRAHPSRSGSGAWQAGRPPWHAHRRSSPFAEGGTFLVQRIVAGSCTAAGRARRTICAFPPAAGCACRYFVSATMAS